MAETKGWQAEVERNRIRRGIKRTGVEERVLPDGTYEETRYERPEKAARFRRASAVRVTKADGSVVEQPPYTPREITAIVRRGERVAGGTLGADPTLDRRIREKGP